MGACKYEKLPRKKVQPDKFRMHLLLMAVVLKQPVTSLIPRIRRRVAETRRVTIVWNDV